MNNNPEEPKSTEVKNKLQFLVELFYGLALASGLQFVTTFLLDPQNGQVFLSPRWCLTVLAVLVSLAIAVLDWLYVALRPPVSEKRGWVLLFDLLFPLSIYSLFITAFRPVMFLAAVMGYSLLAIAWFLSHGRKHGGRLLIYIPVLLSCGAVVVSRVMDFWEGHEFVKSLPLLLKPYEHIHWSPWLPLIAWGMILLGIFLTFFQRTREVRGALKKESSEKTSLSAAINTLSNEVETLKTTCKQMLKTKEFLDDFSQRLSSIKGSCQKIQTDEATKITASVIELEKKVTELKTAYEKATN